MKCKKTPNSRPAFKTFPTKWLLCVSAAASSGAVEQRASRMVLLCAACLRSVAELMDMTQERAWNQFSASKKCL